MSAPAFYREQARRQMAEALEQFLASLRDLGMAPEMEAKIQALCEEKNRRVLEGQFKSGIWFLLERQNLVDFIERLLTRQGTAIDFDDLYQEKAELDERHGLSS